MAGPWEQYAAPADGPWSQYQGPAAPAPKPATRAAAPKPRGLLETIGDNFTAPIKQAYQGLQDANTRSQALTDTVQNRSLKDKFLNAPHDLAMGLKNTVDQGLAAGNVALSPIAGAVNTVTKPVGDTVSNVLYDAGVNAYAPGKALGTAPLGRGEAAQQVTDNLATALSLGLPEKAGPPRPPKLRTAAPKVNPDVALLRSKGVDVLPGAARGGVAKQLEDAGAKLPYLGAKIQGARDSSIGSFNKAVLNDALGEIGLSLPKDIDAGHAANAHAYDAIQDAYNAIKPSQPVILSPSYADVTAHPDFGILSPQSQGLVNRVIQDRVLTKAPGGQLDGDNFSRAVSILRKDIKRTGSGDAEEQLVSGILKDKLDELQGEAMTQNPAYATQKEVVDRAYSKVKTAQDASQSVASEDGVFSPSNYFAAVKKADSSAGKNRFATGRAFNQDFAQAAKKVLSDKVANTGGTAGVLGNMASSLPGTIGALAGGPLGAGLGLGGTAGGLYGASRLYEPAAIAKFNAGLDRKIAGVGSVRLPQSRLNVAPVTPLLAASNLSQDIAALPPLLSRAAAEPPRKRKRKK